MSSDDRVEVGKRIAARRKELGMSQRDLMMRLTPPVSISTMSKIELGLCGSGVTRVPQLAVILETTESALLGRESDGQPEGYY